MFTRYANDVIATCAFGLKIDSIANRNNEFYVMGNILTQFSFVALLKAFLTILCPYIIKVLYNIFKILNYTYLLIFDFL